MPLFTLALQMKGENKYNFNHSTPRVNLLFFTKIHRVLHILGGHDGESDGQCGLLALGHYGDDGALVHGRHRGAGRRQAGTHDVGPAQHEPDSTFVHLLLHQEHGVLVEQAQRRHPRTLALPEEQLFTGRRDYHFYVFVAV